MSDFQSHPKKNDSINRFEPGLIPRASYTSAASCPSDSHPDAHATFYICMRCTRLSANSSVNPSTATLDAQSNTAQREEENLSRGGGRSKVAVLSQPGSWGLCLL